MKELANLLWGIKMPRFMARWKAFVVMTLLFCLCHWAVIGCAPGQGKQMAGGVAQVAATTPGLAHQLDRVYAFLVAQKLIPDNRVEATRVLAALDAIAPMIQQGAAALTGDNINWVHFVLQAALTAAQVMGYVAPLL